MQFKTSSSFIWTGTSLCALTIALATVACDDLDANVEEVEEEELAVEAVDPDPDGAQGDAAKQDEREGVIDLSANPPATERRNNGGRWDKDDDHGGRWDKDDDHGGRWDKDDDHGGRWDKDDDHGGRWDKDDDHGGRWDKDDGHGGRWDKDDGHGGRWDKDDGH